MFRAVALTLRPVCGVAVASRLFIDAAATPWQGGENAQTEQVRNSFTRSYALGYSLTPLRG